MELESLSKLISAIFDATVMPSGWDMLAGKFAETFRSENCSFQVRDAVTGTAQIIGRTPGLDATLGEDYETWYYKDDVWATRALPAALNQPVIGHELIPEDDLVALDFYRDFCAPQNIFHALYGLQDIGDHCIGMINIYRPRDAEPFNYEEKRYLSLILPHIKNAMQMNHQVHTIAQGHTITLSAIDQMSLGVLIVGLGGVVRFSNKTMDRILKSDLGLTVRHGRLAIDDAQAQQTLNKALEDAQKAANGNLFRSGTMIALRDRSDKPLSLLISPLPPGVMGLRPVGPVAAIFINHPEERRKPAEDAISKLYGLTPAEARLAKALLDGDRLQDYAERQGISLHTAKTQLKQVFLKTGHSRQSDLVRDIMSNPVLRMRLTNGKAHP